METWGQWFRVNVDRHFDKLVLLFMLMVWIGLVLVSVHAKLDPGVLSWAREQTTAVQGALLGLLTGIAIGRRMSVSKDPQGKDGDE